MSDTKFVVMLVLFLISFVVGLLSSYIEGVLIGLLAAWGLWEDVKIDRLTERLRRYRSAQDRRLAEACRECDVNDDWN